MARNLCISKKFPFFANGIHKIKNMNLKEIIKNTINFKFNNNI